MPVKNIRPEQGSYGDTKALRRAFASLRKAGYYAKQNYWCCQSCGWSDVPDGLKKVVFYHKQDHDELMEEKSCFLSWAGDGNEIVKIFNDNGVNAEWNGDPSTRIRITLSKL
jgi:hypothetical protein